jgi:hypothetical protein
MFEGVPHFGPLSVWCRHSGIGRSLSIEMVEAGTLPVVEIEGRKWIDIHAGLALLHEAAQTKAPVAIPGEHRTRALARKAAWREARRAERRTEQATLRRARRKHRTSAELPSTE